MEFHLTLNEPGSHRRISNSPGPVIAILDSTGHMVMLHKLDKTQYGSIAVAEDKARSALYFRRPSKVFEELGGAGRHEHASARAARRLPTRGGIPSWSPVRACSLVSS